MNFKHFQVPILISMFLMACQNMDNHYNLDREESEIFTVIIDELAVPLPPAWPPPEGYNSKQLDSIKQIKINLVIDTVMFNLNKRVQLPEHQEKFQPLVDAIPGLPEKTIAPQSVKSSIGHNLKFENTSKESQVIGISRIKFNGDGTRAALYGSRTTGRLSGLTDLFLMEKNNGCWEIVHRQNLERS